MFLMNSQRTTMVNSRFVQCFRVQEMSGSAKVLASYGKNLPLSELGTYRTREEAMNVLHEICGALAAGSGSFVMPENSMK